MDCIKICCDFKASRSTIGRIHGGEMYPPAKEFGKTEKNLRASHLPLICVARVNREKAMKGKDTIFILYRQTGQCKMNGIKQCGELEVCYA